MRLEVIILIILMSSLVVANMDLGEDDSSQPKITMEIPATPDFNNATAFVNSTNYWDNLDTPDDITGSEFWYNQTSDTTTYWNKSGNSIIPKSNEFINLSDVATSTGGISGPALMFSDRVAGLGEPLGPFTSGLNKIDGGEFFGLAGAGADSSIFWGAVDGDALRRFRIQADGGMKWGNGTGLTDIYMYRAGAYLLKIERSLWIHGSTGAGRLIIRKGYGQSTVNLFEVDDAGAVDYVKIDYLGQLHIIRDNLKQTFGAGKDVSQLFDSKNQIVNLEVGTAGNYTFTNFNEIQVVGNFTGENYYGEMWMDNESLNGVAQEIPVADTWYNISVFNQSLNSGQTLNGFTFTNGGNPFLSPLISGKYKIDYSISWELVAGTNDEFEVALAVNDIIQAQTEIHRKIASAGDDGNAGGTGFVDLSVGDIVTLQIKNLDADDNAGIHSVNLNLVRIGD